MNSISTLNRVRSKDLLLEKFFLTASEVFQESGHELHLLKKSLVSRRKFILLLLAFLKSHAEANSN